jgi:hypothetical protein
LGLLLLQCRARQKQIIVVQAVRVVVVHERLSLEFGVGMTSISSSHVG